MNKNLIIIYALIMLECRLSLEDASKIFKVDAQKLSENFNQETLSENIYDAMKYLYHEAMCFSEENKKGLFKANLYIRKLRKILKNPNQEDRKKELELFINDLKGPDINFVLEKPQKCRYTDREKELILKYRLKYCITGVDMYAAFHIFHQVIHDWEYNLPECELKTRLGILRDYLDNRYKGTRRK